MNNESTFLMVLGLLLQTYALAICFTHVKNEHRATSAVFCMIAFAIGLDSFLPALYSFVTGIAPDFYFTLRDGALSVGTIAEGAYWAIYVTSLSILLTTSVGRSLSATLRNMFSPAIVRRGIVVLFVVSAIGTFAIDPEIFLRGNMGGSEALTIDYQSPGIYQFLNPFGRLFLPAIATVMYLSYFGEQQSKVFRWLRYVSFVLLGAFVLVGFVMGARGNLLGVAIMLFFVFVFVYGLKHAFRMFLIVSFIGMLISPVILLYKGDKSAYENLSFGDRIANLVSIGEGVDSGILRNLQELIFRFDGPFNGGNLIIYTLETSPVLATAYLNSIYAFVPRPLWEDKPLSRSVDGTIFTTPNAITGVISDRMVTTAVSPSGVAFWQFGALGVGILAIIQSIVACALLRLATNWQRNELLLFFWLLLDPASLFLNTFHSVLQWVIPLCVAALILSVFRPSR